MLIVISNLVVPNRNLIKHWQTARVEVENDNRQNGYGAKALDVGSKLHGAAQKIYTAGSFATESTEDREGFDVFL